MSDRKTMVVVLVCAAIAICIVLVLLLRSDQVATPQPTAAQIAGSTWLTRHDGSSNVLRGLPIYLLKPRVDGATVRRALEANRNEYLQLAQRERQQAESETLIADLFERQAAEYERKANQIAQQLRQVPASMPVAQFHDLLRRTAEFELAYLSHHVQGLVVASARTDVEGRYQFEDVPPGAYFLWAEMDTRAMYVDWLIPLRVTTQPLSLDLYNDNAATIRNTR